ncbi:MAG: hypothetical protein HOP33_02430 [Verrucomicrobia bacterium]|nr:hypothetical protein [Verrucomicrobiota bacterium]
MPIRLYEIAEAHGDDAPSLRRKAEALGFQIKGFSSSLDKITAEALELAVYGRVLAVRFDALSRHVSTRAPSGADGRLVHLRHLISVVRSLFGETGEAKATETRARQLAHLLAISKHKDRNSPRPLEWQEAEVLIGELARSGVAVQIEDVPRTQVLKHSQIRQRPAKKGQDVRHKKKEKRKKVRKKKHIQPKLKLIYTAFETSRRRH